jgi:hypothetical protein
MANNDFKPQKKKALAIATVEQLLEESRAVIEPLVELWPDGASALTALLGSAGIAIKYKQEVLNQFTEFMMNHQEVFDYNTVQARDFQDGLVVFINSYFKLRSERKMELARKVFYDFGKSTEKPLYPLERYDDTLEKISESGLRLLGFIDSVIPEVMEDYVDSMIRDNPPKSGQEDRERSFYFDMYTRGKPLSFFVQQYIGAQIKESVLIEDGESRAVAEQMKREALNSEMSLGISELEQLGLVHSFTEDIGGWSSMSSTAYSLTHYGRMFISVVKP